MKDILEFIRGIVRPFVICSGWSVWLVMILSNMPVPDILQVLVSAVTIEYVGERGVRHLIGK